MEKILHFFISLENQWLYITLPNIKILSVRRIEWRRKKMIRILSVSCTKGKVRCFCVSGLSSVKLIFQANVLECVQTKKKERHSSLAGGNKRHFQWDLMLGRDRSKHGNNWVWTHWTDLWCLLMFRNKKTPLIQVLCPWIFSSSVQGIGMTLKAKKEWHHEKETRKGSGLFWQEHPEPVKRNSDHLWGQARGHSCQMGPEWNTWLLPKKLVPEKELRPGPRWRRGAQNGEKDSWGWHQESTPGLLKGSPAANKGHCSGTPQPPGRQQTCWEEVLAPLGQLTLDSRCPGLEFKGLIQHLRGED